MTAPGDEPLAVIRYEVTVDDLVKYNEYHMLLSPAALQKRHKLAPRMAIIIAVAYAALAFLCTRTMPAVLGNSLTAAIGLSTGGLIYWRLRCTPPRMANWARKRIRAMYSAGENRATVGEHTIGVSETGITNATAFSTTQIAWGTLERIETTPDYTYLYISAVQAMIVPHNRILEGDFSQFLRAIKAHYKADQALPAAAGVLPAADSK